MPYAAADDTDLHYEVHGRGTPLLLLPGLGSSGDLWGSGFVDQLARAFRVITLDHRGTGLSRHGSGPDRIGVDRLAEDACRVLDGAGLLSAHVFGMSLGGMVALSMAVHHPARVRGLVLGGTSAGGGSAVPSRQSAMEQLQREGIMGISGLLVTSEYIARRTGLLTRLAVRAMARPPAPRVIAEQLAAVAAFDLSARLGSVIAPTLVITGDRDELVPPENSRLLARGIRGARGVLVRDTGHCFYWEAPERAAAAIVDFLVPLAPVPVR